ncbi:MAG TPA: HAD hydrolase-like protein [bacterium]|nr:HAD hydrolase-like protein [bacterium]HQL62762.1 HAD hydrolase-like protein [bacterium]
MSKTDRSVLLDRDGVITAVNPDGIKKPEEVLVLPFSAQAFYELAQCRVKPYVIVHEPLVGEGKMTEADLKAVHARLVEIVRQEFEEVDLGEFVTASLPDGPATPSAKIKAGLLRKLARERGVNLAETYYIGDEESDMEAADEVGCRFCLVRSGRGFRTVKRVAVTGKTPDLICRDLLSAVIKIFKGG